MGLRLVSTVLALCAGSLTAGDVCDLTFTACPGQLAGAPIQVPLDVISLDARIPVCLAKGRIKANTPPSIMFVIDHSGSMDGTDPLHARYTVTTRLLDSIHAAVPNARVGVAVFAGRLAFDYRDNSFFQPLFPGDDTQHDSFIPLTALDTTFSPGGTRGLDTIKALLGFTPSGKRAYLNHETKRPDERKPLNNLRETGTDITLGFQAALEAMKTTPSPKNAQFIIFLSDGEAAPTDDSRQAIKYDFVAGKNTPTTFTVFFNPRTDIPPLELVQMTDNIKANNYSASNPNSAIYTINLPATELQTLLQESVLNQILTVPATARELAMSIDSGARQKTSNRPDSSHFLFASRMPLNAGTTELQLAYSHSYIDSTVTPPRLIDTIVVYNLTVTRSATGTVGGIVSKTCRDQPDLALFSGGTALTSVSAGQTRLEVRLTPPAGSAPCAGCTVQVKPSLSLDQESFPLAAGGAYAAAPFTRKETVTPVPGDGILQHRASDSLILVWTNPENPLDMVRRAYPYQTFPSTLALYAGGKPVDIVTADHSRLEVRLTRGPGVPCAGCTVEISASFGADRQTVPLVSGGDAFLGSFVRIESITPVPADGILQHLSADSIIVTWVNPDNPQDIARRSYPYRPILPALEVHSEGKALDVITTLNRNLEIHLTLPSGEPCAACVVQVFPSGGADREAVVMSGAGSPYLGGIQRRVDSAPDLDNDTLEHRTQDSLIFFYQNPLNPSQQVRRAYPYFEFSNIARIAPANDVARLPAGQASSDGRQWIISDAPDLLVDPSRHAVACCRVLAVPANSRSPDSISSVGIRVEASREFTLELMVFSNLGQVVNRLSFTVPRSEFPKLTPVPGKEARYLRLLWNGLAEDGSRAGSGAYIFKTTITLPPMQGIANSGLQTHAIRTVGILRGGS